ncbi:unnamed protein product [Symbiodinium sp. CCMP2592]|nr:unnamed protein product [Symbiodinium sp. CCMP2592]
MKWVAKKTEGEDEPCQWPAPQTAARFEGKDRKEAKGASKWTAKTEEEPKGKGDRKGEGKRKGGKSARAEEEDWSWTWTADSYSDWWSWNDWGWDTKPSKGEAKEGKGKEKGKSKDSGKKGKGDFKDKDDGLHVPLSHCPGNREPLIQSGTHMHILFTLDHMSPALLCCAPAAPSFFTTVGDFLSTVVLWLLLITKGIAVPSGHTYFVDEPGYDQGKLYEFFVNSFYPFSAIKGVDFEKNLNHEHYDYGFLRNYRNGSTFLLASGAPSSPSSKGLLSPLLRRCDHFLRHYLDFLQLIYGIYAQAGEMASTSSVPHTGVSLHEIRKDIPPGWAPGLPDYPLKLFFDRLKLWYQVYDGDDTMVGPLVAGRLQGKAQRLGLTLRLPRPDGTVDVGGVALSRLAVDEVRDPANPNVILQAHIPSGIQALCNALKDAFGISDQEMVSKSLEEFFEFRRGKLSFQEYAIEWDYKLEEATTRAGLVVNEVAKFYLFFRGANLPAKFVEDIKMQLQGDMRLFQDARTLALRIISRKEEAGQDILYEEDPEDHDGFYDWYEEDGELQWDEPWDTEAWYETDWHWIGEYDYENHSAEYEGANQWYEEPGDSAPADAGDHPDYHGEEATSPSSGAATTQESYPMKGKGKGKGPGCSVCGSKWHSAASCPVGGGGHEGGKGKGHYGPSSKGRGKGYGGGYGSGYGGGYSGGYGKGKKGKSKGKSKGKWMPRFKGYGGYGGNKGNKGYYGYSEKTLNQAFGDSKAAQQATPPRKVVHFNLGESGGPVINLNRAPTSSGMTEETQDAAPDDYGSKAEKRLAFSFASSIYSTEAYHTVQGEKRRGLLVDPGAASGLVGSETLRDLLEACDSGPVRWDRQKTNNVSGISGNSESTLGEIEIPLMLDGARGSYKADVLGGDGSLCPALLSNPALRRQKAAILSDWFSNGDGVLVIQTEERECHYLRLLLTDSGHYLLPVDGTQDVTNKTKGQVHAQLHCWTQEIANRWPDVRANVKHCFYESAISSQERERCRDNSKNITEDEITSSSPTATTSGSVREAHEIDDSKNITEDEITSSSPTATTSGSHDKPFLSGPAHQVHAKEDYWEHHDNTLVRVHRVPRRVLFTPDCALDCPVEPELLLGQRKTHIQALPKKTGMKYLNDDWHVSSAPNKDLAYLWTGKAVFQVRAPEPDPAMTKPTAMQFPTTTTTSTAPLDAEHFPVYTGDTFPEHWDDSRRSRATQYYKAIPEEFYTKSGRRPVTPWNAKAWLQKVRSTEQPLRLQFWEMCSGSGRLSLICLLAGLTVGFPIDHRYGWDLGHPPHQSLLQECHNTFCTDHLFMAPNCGPWSVASSSKESDKRSSDRDQERPTLEYLQTLCLWQHNSGRAFTVEQPLTSSMFKESAMARLLEHEGIHRQRFDQCMLGAQDESSRPVRKTTAFFSNRRWKQVLRRCGGHKGKQHGTLQGQWQGCNRTALAAVYPRRLCHAAVQDLWSILRRDHSASCKPWPRQLWWLHELYYYSCERCQLGRSAPPGCEHTMVPGECRYGQPSMRGVARQARPQRSDMEDPTAAFKMLARSGDYSGVDLQVDDTVSLAPEPRLYLKAALTNLLKSCIGIFQEATNVDYDHWLDDPVLFQVFQDVFDSQLQVLGVMCSLRPWHLKVPDPYLSSACAPLRLMIRGGVRAWRVHAIEDMRMMSENQLKAKVEEADWVVTLFGFRNGDPDVDRPGASGVGGSLPSSARPAAPLVPAAASSSPKRENDGRSSASSSAAPPRLLEPRPPPQDDAAAEPGEEQEEFEAVRPEGEEQSKTIKPLFDYKKVYKRLQSGIIESDPHTAKRLLLGLHERFYHCPITDFKNMLLRAGLPSDISPLAEEAVMSCSICRKYVRLPNRPQVKIGSNAGTFNYRIQIDLFMYKETWVLLVICEATRLKAAAVVNNKSHTELLGKLCDCWIYIYGAPHQLVLDQETSLMSHEAAHEMERFNIERVPKGTTAGPAAEQHTGTGLVERHVGLMELTMAKLEAEMDRQGVQLRVPELCKESAIAHNQTLNYGGATPCMAVYGVLPRPYYDVDQTTIAQVAGALQTDITPFERALRIRQMALSMVHQAVAEDRIARANRTRPHQLKVGELIPGTTKVDFHREVQGDVGWRGPAELLKLDVQEGTAILSYQGRPYLVSLRHIRPHQAGVFVSFSEPQAEAFNGLRKLVEELSPYKVTTVGWLTEQQGDLTMWRRASTSSLAFADTWTKIVSVGKALAQHNVAGGMFGQGVKTLHPPTGSCGVLIMLTCGTEEHTCHEHNNDQPITMKKVTTKAIDNLAFLYIYYYINTNYEPANDIKIIPSEGAVDADDSQPMDIQPQSPQSATSPTTPQSTTTPMSDDDGSLKRKGPESRTVTLGPETKKTKLEALLDNFDKEKVITYAQHNMLNLYWMMRRTQNIPLDFPTSWFQYDNQCMIALWDDHMGRLTTGRPALPTDHTVVNYYVQPAQHLFVWPSKRHQELLADINSGEIYKVDEETNNIGEHEIYEHWPLVDKADGDEVRQFVETKSFKKMHRNGLTSDVVIVDCIWVRKWKRYPDGTRRVKSRLCARGCFDSQKEMLSTRSTTATRLSQRILMSTSATQDFDIESWDVTAAFLKGLTFEKIRELLRSKGISAPLRKVAVIVPRNVWRHLAKYDATFQVPEDKIDEYVLLCLKPIYGLNDAPLAWQLCLHQHFESQGGIPSLMDENLFFWMKKKEHAKTDKASVLAIATTHVDDVGAGSKSDWLKEQYDLLCAKFGKVTRQQLPFTHCGVVYSKTATGFMMSQDEFCSKLKPAPIPAGKKDDSPLEPSEVTSFRSILGALLWLTATRLDIIADVSHLQTQVTNARVRHLKEANTVVARAKAEVGCAYIILLMEDRIGDMDGSMEKTLSDHETAIMGGAAHILWGHGAKAKRISYSTSHAETLAAVSGLETSSLVAVRLAEVLYMSRRPTIQGLLACQEGGVRQLPVDDYTDCRDFFELASGDKSVPQDKGQRLYVLAFREARLHGRLRWLALTPTQSMTADGLTKSMVAPPLMSLLSTGVVRFYNHGAHQERGHSVYGFRVCYVYIKTYVMFLHVNDWQCYGFNLLYIDHLAANFNDFILYDEHYGNHHGRRRLVMADDDDLSHHRR